MMRARGRDNRAAVNWHVAACAVLLSCVFATRVARAQPDPKMVCVQAHAAGQQHMQRGELLAASEQFITCAQTNCPDLVKSECAELLEDARAALPSIVIVAEDSTGGDVADVRVTLDGNRLTEVLDGKPVSLDPGPHTLRFERRGSEPTEKKIIVQAGAKYREVKVRFASGAAPTSPAVSPAVGSATEQPDTPQSDTPQPGASQPADSSGVSPLVYIGFAVAGAGLVVGAITGGIAASKAGELKDSCPDDACPRGQTEDDYDSTFLLAHVSTAGFIVAGVGTAVGLVGLFALGDDEPEQAAWNLQPIIGPGFVGIEGSY